MKERSRMAVSRGWGCASGEDAPARRLEITPDEWNAIADELHLTSREVEIVEALLDGRHEPEIGPALGISSHTVHTHLGRIYRKLGVHGLSDLLLVVFRTYLAQFNGRSESQNAG